MLDFGDVRGWVVCLHQIQVVDLVEHGRFKDGGRGPTEFDCWGLATEIFRRCGIAVPDYKISCDASEAVSAQMNAEKPYWIRCEGEPPVPSLIGFIDRGLLCHCGVYLGNGQFIHAHERNGIEITQTSHILWRRRIEGYYVPRWANVKHSIDQKPDTARPQGRT